MGSDLMFVVGARPNFVKAAPVVHEAAKRGRPFVVVHTGQHYDEAMSAAFLRDLEIPPPDISLGVGSGTHARQTAAVMVGMEEAIQEREPRFVVVFGDVNSTVAASLAAVKLHVPVAHVEAGLRSRDRRMPEEINRILTDQIADLLFVTERSGVDNLASEGVAAEGIHLVGNTMIDTLASSLEAARARADGLLQQFGVERRAFAVLTMHRPSNVDDAAQLAEMLEALAQVAERAPIVFPVHPRTMQQLPRLPDVFRPVDPMGYLDFLALTDQSCLVLTDSGGLQEETTFLGIPCVTIRDTTERPITLTHGTNVLAGTNPDDVVRAAFAQLDAGVRDADPPPLWDGCAAGRILDVFETFL